ncbi:DUF2231 domain-containing protein [Vitreimonas sp.]|uniref:DUF2231 domain-containing protein n=1 Tax=Vitreimonas sp. TaxID=3069702 RepID=UPI0039C96218
MYENPKSTAKIGGHPIHPMLIVFPIAFWIGALVCDLVYASNPHEDWAQAAAWLTGAGVVTALVAALAGFTDFFGDSRIRALRDAWRHMVGNLIAVTLAAVSWGVRLSEGAAEAVLPWGLTLSAAVGVILLYTGWKGGELAYRHRVGVMQPPSDTIADRQPQTIRTRERI